MSRTSDADLTARIKRLKGSFFNRTKVTFDRRSCLTCGVGVGMEKGKLGKISHIEREFVWTGVGIRISSSI